MLPPLGWQYTQLTHDRRQRLEEQVPLKRLVGEILTRSDLCGVDVHERCDEAKLKKVIAHRVTFQLHPRTPDAHDALDCLLNGAFGLRARYCASSEDGARATAFVCSEVAGAIRARRIGFVNGVLNEEVAASILAMETSLCQPSAKVWFDPATDKRATILDEGHVASATWDQGRRQPQLVRVALPSLSFQQIEASIMKGGTVPQPEFLDIKGAFVTAEGTEFVPESKRTRPLQIHLMGWT